MNTLTVTQAARRLNVTTSTVARWVKTGTFPNAYKLNPLRPNSPVRIPEDDIIAFENLRHQK